MTTDRKKILITGGNSGIGLALADEFARRGYDIGITGRDQGRLEAARSSLEKRGVRVVAKSLDAMDFPSIFKVVSQMSAELGGLDILVANAGVGGGQQPGQASFDANRICLETNLVGAVATLAAGFEIMKKQKHGLLVGISSVAGFRGLPGNAAYSASKAGLTTFLEGFRGEVKRYGIGVTDIMPGFIDTPLNRSLKSRPFVIPVEKGARIIANAIESRKSRAVVPWFPWAVLGYVMRRLPTFLWSASTALK
jgi:short-subunit dehydrogenase